MKKIFKLTFLSILFTMSLFAAEGAIKIPMDPRLLSTDKGGLLSAKEAYQDGTGIIVVGDLGREGVDNKSMNKLVYKYGDKAEEEGKTISEYIIDNSGLLPEEDVKLAGDIGGIDPIQPLDGFKCDDGSAATGGDAYDSNGLCSGNLIGGTCDDGDSNTGQDKFDSNGNCIGEECYYNEFWANITYSYAYANYYWSDYSYTGPVPVSSQTQCTGKSNSTTSCKTTCLSGYPNCQCHCKYKRCPSGYTLLSNGSCRKTVSSSCPSGYTKVSSTQCKKVDTNCP